ncbi:MAG: hypothetical protein MUC36_14035 [Planctomycetes bacterium]|jgi:hypothetical protein|nr:hypothetical protein [Planctomycetota bacterium]
MRKMLFPTCLCLAAASLASQNYLALPATASPAGELGNFSLVPFMQPNARVQMFYDAAEVGSNPFVTDELSLRFDGPIPQVGAPGPFSITRLQIRIGVTAVAAPSADFAANLTQPLQTVFDGPRSYLPDPGFGAPHPWGGVNNTLSFPFSSPATLVVAPGQWLVVELVMEGNNIASFGFAHAILDGAPTSGGITDGTVAAYGQGCSAGGSAPAATISTSGIYAPGGAHRVTGQNLGANALVLAVFGLSNSIAFAPLPFTLPGTTCTLLASPDFTLPAVADGNGTLGASQGPVLSLPANPALGGIVIFEQLASLVPTANPWGLVLSNAAAVTLGSWNPLGRGTYLAAHDSDQNAQYANQLRAFGMALRLRTL